MNPTNTMFIAAIILFITNVVILVLILAPILFQVFIILKRFNQLLHAAENILNQLNKKNQELLSLITRGTLVKAIKKTFSKKESK